MDVSEVNMRLLDELEEMGFPLARATRALLNSGNSSLVDAINWIVDHEDDPEIDQVPLVSIRIEIEDVESSFGSEEVKIKAQKLRDKTRERKNEDKNLERDKEKERKKIRAGQEVQESKIIAEENERKRFVDLRKAEKLEENKARERIRWKLHHDKEIVSVNSTRVGVDLSPKVDRMRDILRSLKRNNKDDDNIKVRRAFETLLIYVRNVARDPNEDKFRKIRLSNPAFKERVGIFEQGIKFLELCEFKRVESDRYLFLQKSSFDMALFISAGNVLQSAITNPFFGLVSKEQ